MNGIIRSWGRILAGYTPSLSIEITRECPLRCPGCYAYGAEHLGGGVTLREVRDFKGQALIDGILGLVERHRPMHLSLVGGEPLVRYRELDVLLPQLSAQGLHVQVVTSAVRPIPEAWATIPRLSVVVSIDGLPAEHDVRRAPATYDRILKHIVGQRIVVHCEFAAFWSDQPHARKIWFSLYTPQVGEESAEKLRPEDRAQVVRELLVLRKVYPKIEMPEGLINVYAKPPASPEECIFSRVTHSMSADLQTHITPCQFGGTPDCENCGCIASAGLGAIGRHRLFGVMPIDPIFDASINVGRAVRKLRGPLPGGPPVGTPEPEPGV
jgi:organic radical activating enzyme